MKRVVIALLLGAVGLAACGEGKVETADKAAGYQGKPDIHAWDSPEAGGAKAEHERQIEARTLNQNEYTRTR
jgi:ABC-type glycerol-3-phosphate transport system substrate-binding protein